METYKVVVLSHVSKNDCKWQNALKIQEFFSPKISKLKFLYQVTKNCKILWYIFVFIMVWSLSMWIVLTLITKWILFCTLSHLI